MLLDNTSRTQKVYEWIEEYTKEGTLDIVSGYFTIGILNYLTTNFNSLISKYRMILGDIVHTDPIMDRPLDLLNENITVDAALQLNSIANQAVAFLKQNNVRIKTLEPNFCHAKIYLHDTKDTPFKYCISGSSNLTESGLGLNPTNNVELNVAYSGSHSEYNELSVWFKELWNNPKAHTKKSIVDKNGNKTKIDFKEYLIKEIELIFKKYTPHDIYYKILFQLFGADVISDEADPQFLKDVGKLQNSVIYNVLYEFQQKGAMSLIKMLQRYDGAILADAVGLGKTWTALAVIKFFQLQGRQTILLCPKKLENNWRMYLKYQDSRFEKDDFEYFIRFHTDLSEERMEKYKDLRDKFFRNDKPKLLVIDESHNLRNNKSQRYDFLLNKILTKNQDIKVLLLSATPINNSLNDIRNQYWLMTKQDNSYYRDSLGIRNIEASFRKAQKAFNDWRKEDNPRIDDFLQKLPKQFFDMSDALTVARTRQMVADDNASLIFPEKEVPDNYYITPTEFGNYETFDELMSRFPPLLSGYQPFHYVGSDIIPSASVLDDEKQRDMFLVKMMYMLIVKRLESSWKAFYLTICKILDYHQKLLDLIKAYKKNKENQNLDLNKIEDEVFDALSEQFSLKRKKPISLADIDMADGLDEFQKDIKDDIDAMENLKMNLEKFSVKIKEEEDNPEELQSADIKLKKLMEIIKEKWELQKNNGNRKIVIFTHYRDTAEYLFNQLKRRGYDKLAMVSGTGSLVWDSDEESKYFEHILERFAPFTKLYRERDWKFDIEDGTMEKYDEWKNWLKENEPEEYEKVNNPIDILITTDCLSEGQNLQDADMVINYDIHWNPVRVIQRMGRIDRIGSPNDTIKGVNFWPADDINGYLGLQDRIEERMAQMKMVGSEVDENFTDSFKEIVKDNKIERKLNDRMIEQMKVTWDDIEVNDNSFGFNNLSLEKFRHDLIREFEKQKDYYDKMPNGIYSGYKAIENQKPEGIIALLAYPAKAPGVRVARYDEYDLVYLGFDGKNKVLNQSELLQVLHDNKDEERYVPDTIDRGEQNEIENLKHSFQNYFAIRSGQGDISDSPASYSGNEASDVLSGIADGDKKSLNRMKQNLSSEDKYQLQNFDLITWLLVTK